MTELLHGQDIAKLLGSEGPIVKCVLLRAFNNDDCKKPSAKLPADEETKPTDTNVSRRPVLVDLIDEIKVDTTPKKSMVAQILGGPFTFVGQYEEEGIVLMMRRPPGQDNELPLNTHKLQPPFDETEIRGDILIMKVAPTEEVLDEESEENIKELEVPSNQEFFLDYTKDEYVAFASRTDVVAPEPTEEESEEEEEVEEDGDEESEQEGDDGDEEYNVGEDEEFEDEDEQVAMMNLIMGQVLRKFHEENGRGPDTRELLSLRSALAEKMGIEMPEIPEHEADWDRKATKKTREKVETNDEDSPVKSILTRKRTIDDEDHEGKDNSDQDAKRVKFSHPSEEDQGNNKAVATAVSPEGQEA